MAFGPVPQGDPDSSARVWIREYFADLAHVVWSRWMTTVISKAKTNADGSITIPAGYLERWKRQSGSRYWKLSEDEKANAREIADTFLKALEEFFRK